MTLEINPEGAIFLDGWNTGAYMRKAAGKYRGISGDNIAPDARLSRKCYEMHPGPAAPGVGTLAQLEADLNKIIMTPAQRAAGFVFRGGRVRAPKTAFWAPLAAAQEDAGDDFPTPGESLRAIDEFDMELAKSARWPEPNSPRIPSPVPETDVFDEIAVITVAVALADANTPQDNDAKRAVRAAALSRAFRAGVEAAKHRALGAGYAVFVAVSDGGDHAALLTAFLSGADSWGASDV